VEGCDSSQSGRPSLTGLNWQKEVVILFGRDGMDDEHTS
jgi:hypothetical protein